MAIEDLLVTTYLCGKSDEINNYIKRDNNNEKELKAAFIVGGLASFLTLSTPIWPVLALDTMARIFYSTIKKEDYGLKQYARSPGIIGIIREYVK